MGSGPDGWQTGEKLMGIDQVLLTEVPVWGLVHGVTSSTLARARAALKPRAYEVIDQVPNSRSSSTRPFGWWMR